MLHLFTDPLRVKLTVNSSRVVDSRQPIHSLSVACAVLRILRDCTCYRKQRAVFPGKVNGYINCGSRLIL